MDTLDYQFESSKKFCREGISYLLKADNNQENICFAIVMLQTSIELLIKHNQIQKLSSKSKTQIKKVLNKDFGTLKSEALSNIRDDIFSSEILNIFQKLRNKIVHEGFSDNRDFGANIRDSCLLIVHGFSTLLDTDVKLVSPEERIFILKNYIGKQFNELINFGPYVCEVKKIVSEKNNIAYCGMCSNKTVVIYSDEHLCFLCGFSAPHFTSSYLDCPTCNEVSGFMYDKLNRGITGQYFGKCLRCDQSDEVIVCEICNSNYFLVHEGFENQDDIKKYYKQIGISYCPKCIKEGC